MLASVLDVSAHPLGLVFQAVHLVDAFLDRFVAFFGHAADFFPLRGHVVGGLADLVGGLGQFLDGGGDLVDGGGLGGDGALLLLGGGRDLGGGGAGVLDHLGDAQDDLAYVGGEACG